ncbi:hypothetical protein BTJ68_11210 [Hortaea werneckii EXF-2000]|uniref:Uncharacterized protein n=2 Tax=Hortaea werneckii TaxID=91943 RepID=A0A3M7IVU5_HORWE|nr:hypothetical protein BTJ68_11210 [Hortaea werneckii EXF-2000]RMZ29472.1 hypothetical protein D0859_06436 [Hortaea werneckii]
MVKCDSCGASVDLAKGSNMGHCATCNNIVEVKEQPQQQPQDASSKAGADGGKEGEKK